MDRCDIVITAYRLNAVLPPAKGLNRVLGLSEAEAAALAKRFPCVVRANEEVAEAERLCAALNEVGAYAELQAHEEPEPVAPVAVAKAEVAPTPQAQPPSAYVIGDLTIGAAEPARVAAAAQPKPADAPQPATVRAAPEPRAATPLPSAENAVSGNVQMLDDGFGGETEQGPVLELDFEGKGKQTGKAAANAMTDNQGPGGFDDDDDAQAPALELDYGVKSTGKVQAKQPAKPSPKVAAAKQPVQAKSAAVKKPAAAPAPLAGQKYAIHGASAEGPRRGQINVRDKTLEQRGFLASVFLPLVLLYGVAPKLCIYGGIAIAAGVAVYSVYGTSSEDGSARAQSAGVESSSELQPSDQTTVDAAEGDATDKESGKAAATPTAPKGMEWSVATARRERMNGVHKVKVSWPASVKGDASLQRECVLLDTKYTSKLDDLESTGSRFEPPPAVAKQLEQHTQTLQATKRYRGRTFVSVCLSNH